MTEVRDARTPGDLAAVRVLFEEYAAALGIPLCFQGFAAELDGLPGAYAPPAGRLLLAHIDGEAAGAVGLRPLLAAHCSCGTAKLMADRPDTAEVKRLYVPPWFRGRGVGRLLAERVLTEAAAAGYRRVCLDTLPSMAGAIALYKSLGFAEVAPYYTDPVPGALFFAREVG